MARATTIAGLTYGVDLDANGEADATFNSGPTRSGGWRPDVPFLGRPGLKVAMKAERGVTPDDFLQVPFRFQTGPLDRWGRSWEMDFPTYDTIAEGERPQIGGRRLERPSFQTMLLDEDLRFMVWNGTYNVQRMLRELRAIMEKPAPFRLVISQTGLWGARPLMNMVAVLTSLRPEQRGGEVGTEYADVEFLEWPSTQLTRERTRRPSSKDKERRHEIKKGDTLYSVALAAYGRRSAWRLVASSNGIKDMDPDDGAALAKWAKTYDRKTLKVPPLIGTVGKVVGAGAPGQGKATGFPSTSGQGGGARGSGSGHGSIS